MCILCIFIALDYVWSFFFVFMKYKCDLMQFMYEYVSACDACGVDYVPGNAFYCEFFLTVRIKIGL